MMIELTNTTLQGFTSEGVNLIDIKTDWCQPCKVMLPILEDLSTEFLGTIKFGKIDADKELDLVKSLGIRNIPTILIYKDGEIVNRKVGMSSKEDLRRLLNEQLSPADNS